MRKFVCYGVRVHKMKPCTRCTDTVRRDAPRPHQHMITTARIIHPPKRTKAVPASLPLLAYEMPKQRVGTARCFPPSGLGSCARLVAIFGEAVGNLVSRPQSLLKYPPTNVWAAGVMGVWGGIHFISYCMRLHVPKGVILSFHRRCLFVATARPSTNLTFVSLHFDLLCSSERVCQHAYQKNGNR